jgi:protocatechuate 3,4-dioxygenase beta subunit
MVGYSAPLEPGRYAVLFKLLFPGWNAQLMDWQGQLETGPAQVQLLAAGANSPMDEAKGSALAATAETDHSAYFGGQVVDGETGKPVKEFQVQLGSAKREKPDEITWRPEFNSATLPYPGNNYDNQGRFGAETLQAYSRGKAWARVLADGYLPQTVTPEPVVSPSRVENLVVRLKKGRELSGSVFDAAGRPAARARVFLAGTQGLSEAQQQLWFKSTTAITDSDGRFTLHGVGAPGQQVTAFSSSGLEAVPALIPEPGQELKIILP